MAAQRYHQQTRRAGQKAYLPTRFVRCRDKFGKAGARLKLVRRNMDLQSVTLAKVLSQCAQFLDGSLDDMLRTEGTSWKVSLEELPRIRSSAWRLLLPHFVATLHALDLTADPIGSAVYNGTNALQFGRWCGFFALYILLFCHLLRSTIVVTNASLDRHTNPMQTFLMPGPGYLYQSKCPDQG